MTGHVTGHIVTGRLALVNSLKIGPVAYQHCFWVFALIF